MLFLLHILGLVYGLSAALVTGLRLNQDVVDNMPDTWLSFIDSYFPQSVFRVWKKDVSYEQADTGQSYLLSAGLVAWSAYWLKSRHRVAR